MKHKAAFFLATIFSLLFKFSNGQMDTLVIKGRVTDCLTKESIPFATVAISSFSTMTDLDGNFTLKYPYAINTKFKLTVKYLAYNDYSVTLNKKKSRKELKINLKPSTDPARVPEIYAPQEPMKKEK